MHKVMAAATKRREILERFFCEAIVGVVVEVVDGADVTYAASTSSSRAISSPARSSRSPM